MEVIARFLYDDQKITEELREIRHQIRKLIMEMDLAASREVQQDVGYHISAKTTLDKKENLKQLVRANFKRLQEALRVIEETLKILDFRRKW